MGQLATFTLTGVDVWERALNLGTKLSCRTLHSSPWELPQTFADSNLAMLPRPASAPLVPVPDHTRQPTNTRVLLVSKLECGCSVREWVNNQVSV